jgi:hypothetical protein
MSDRKGGGQNDRQNKDAPQVNPEKSGVRTGNKQLDPDHARKTDGGRGAEEKQRHRPDD